MSNGPVRNVRSVRAGERIETPWGQAQTVEVICAGVERYSTASHGGFRVSDEAFRKMPALFRGCRVFAGDCWYEEDVDGCLVVLAFHEHFSDMDVWQVMGMLRAANYHPAAVQFMDSDGGRVLREREARFVREHGHLYLSGTMSSSEEGWTVSFRRISDGARATGVGLTTDEAFERRPVDLEVFGSRIVLEARVPAK